MKNLVLCFLLLCSLKVLAQNTLIKEYYNNRYYVKFFSNEKFEMLAPNFEKVEYHPDNATIRCSSQLESVKVYKGNFSSDGDTIYFKDNESQSTNHIFLKVDSITIKLFGQIRHDTTFYPGKSVYKSDTINSWLFGEMFKLRKEYYNNGSLKAERSFTTWKQPRLVSLSRFIPFGNRLNIFESYHNKIPHGKWKFYNIDGKLIRKIKYKKGIITNANNG